MVFCFAVCTYPLEMSLVMQPTPTNIALPQRTPQYKWTVHDLTAIIYVRFCVVISHYNHQGYNMHIQLLGVLASIPYILPSYSISSIQFIAIHVSFACPHMMLLYLYIFVENKCHRAIRMYVCFKYQLKTTNETTCLNTKRSFLIF